MKLWLAILIVLAGCGDDVSMPDASLDASMQDADVSTLAGACSAFAAYYCDALLPCAPDGGMAPSRGQCIEVSQNYCCEGTQCAASAPPLQPCYDAIDALTCNQLVLGVMPAECAPFQEYGP
jgi:hypothetical protein